MREEEEEEEEEEDLALAGTPNQSVAAQSCPRRVLGLDSKSVTVRGMFAGRVTHGGNN